MKFLGEPSESSPSSTNTSQRSPANSSVSNSRSPKSCLAHFTRLLLGWSLRESQASTAIVSPPASTSKGTSSFSPNFVSRSSTSPISAGYQPSSMISLRLDAYLLPFSLSSLVCSDWTRLYMVTSPSSVQPLQHSFHRP